MREHQKNVELFMQLADQATPRIPVIPNSDVRRLRAKLTIEECFEKLDALGFELLATGNNLDPLSLRNCILAEVSEGDIEQVADAIADISVVIVGTAIAYGINIVPIIEEVDKKNLQKFSGDAHRREDGKWIKPSDWKPPEIMKLLVEQGYVPF